MTYGEVGMENKNPEIIIRNEKKLKIAV